MFTKVLVANRGEIAVRIMRTCREMGIRTVAVHSRADGSAPHVQEADEALFLDAPEPPACYLSGERIIAGAVHTGAQAIHPGYGFLAENPDFAGKCEEAGVAFVGPPADVIRRLGNKTEARRLMESAGVPVIPGMERASSDLGELLREGKRLGFPILVKAAAGGGGKGMRAVDTPADLEEGCAAAMSEAAAAFKDGSLYLEKLLPAPRHIEFQVLADSHGNLVHLFERECSIQRRYQKIIEETPSPALTHDLRARMARAALDAARVSGYVNAGTVEFLLDDSGEFYFLEVNTRLQVEHPVTEMTTGIDLVREQLAVAAGEALPFTQDEVVQVGHAMECRIYAEDPEADFRPCPGLVELHRAPAGPGIRNDGGICEGFEVPVEYDPILAKLVVGARTREAARRRMVRALEEYAILGIRTNIPFLADVVRSTPFMKGETRTDFIPRYLRDWKQPEKGGDLAAIAFVADELCRGGATRRREEAQAPPTPWETLGNWRP